ncbi:MAG TPA: long-chain fatty acid--CoA ligase, partial [Cytophagaceae bacterium]
KEMFKTSGGKYIAPQMLENKFKESRVIEQIMVIGDGQKFPAALIVPSFIGLRSWCEIKGIPYTTDEEMVKQQEIKEKFLKEITQLNQSFAQYERIKKFEILPLPWTIESGEMTPTLKLKRKNIFSNNKALIEKLYSGLEG